MKQRWTRHGWVIGILALLVVGHGVLLWFHPTLGFIRGGFLNGADLRDSIIQISLWLLLTFGLVSTAALRALAFIKRDALAFVVAYLSALVASGLAMVVLDRFY